MKTLTNKEGEALLVLFKDFSSDYNANSISKRIDVTPRGALKILNNLYSENILIRRILGKAIYYKVNFEDIYAKRLIETLLMKESREKAPRWLSEFEGLFGVIQAGIIYGSAVRDYKKAKDIDLLLIIEKEKYKETLTLIDEKDSISLKPIHPLILGSSDLEKNLKNRNQAMINAIREGHVLCGYAEIIEVMRRVTSF